VRESLSRCLLLLVALSLVSAVVSPMWAADYSRVGVHPGDSALYRYTYDWEGISEHTTESHNFNITVLIVNGTTIAFNETDFAANGSVSGTALLSIDVTTGSLSNSSSALLQSKPFFVAAGLAPGDPVYSGLNQEINSTSTRMSGGAYRQCNYLTLPLWSCCWDQATGLLVYKDSLSFLAAGMYSGWAEFKTELIATSLWPPFDPTIPILIGVGLIGSAGVAIAVLALRRKESRVAQPRSVVGKTQTGVANQAEYCTECGSVLTGAPYCTSCGNPVNRALSPKRIDSSSQATITSRRSSKKVIGQKCMVCNLPIRAGEEVARCPHCRNVAHKEHMLEWLHVRGTCPACGEHIEHSHLGTS
jgi:hypothetical protein